MVGYAEEASARFFGAEVFNHTGIEDGRFFKPVASMGTLTVTGLVAM